MKRSKFLDSVREAICRNHLSYSTEKTYVSWIYRFIVFHGKGDNDRRTILPGSLVPQLKIQIEKVGLRFEENMLLNEFRGASMQEDHCG